MPITTKCLVEKYAYRGSFYESPKTVKPIIMIYEVGRANPKANASNS